MRSPDAPNPTPAERPTPEATRGRPAAVLMSLEALVLLVLTAILLADVLGGDSRDLGTVVAEAALVLVFAALAAALARGLWLGGTWARTPALLWHLLMLPVAFSMFGAGRTLLGAGLLAVAVVGVVTVWRAPIADPEAG